MSYRTIVVAAVLAAFVGGAWRAWAQDVSDLSGRMQRPVKQQLVGAGKWQSRRTGSDNNWHIQVKRRDDDSLDGRITVVGSPLIQQARIEGQISGSEVYGVVVGDNDVQVATFTGSIFKGGMSGMYTTTEGDSGDWSWDRPEGFEPKELSGVSEEPSALIEPPSGAVADVSVSAATTQ
jgi:hypothetical protein